MSVQLSNTLHYAFSTTLTARSEMERNTYSTVESRIYLACHNSEAHSIFQFN